MLDSEEVGKHRPEYAFAVLHFPEVVLVYFEIDPEPTLAALHHLLQVLGKRADTLEEGTVGPLSEHEGVNGCLLKLLAGVRYFPNDGEQPVDEFGMARQIELLEEQLAELRAQGLLEGSLR